MLVTSLCRSCQIIVIKYLNDVQVIGKIRGYSICRKRIRKKPYNTCERPGLMLHIGPMEYGGKKITHTIIPMHKSSKIIF